MSGYHPLQATSMSVLANIFEASLPKRSFFQYEEFDLPETKTPTRRRLEIIDKLQTTTSPQTFTPRAVYDGKRIMYSPHPLAFGELGAFDVNMSSKPGPPNPRAVIKVKLTKSAGSPIDFSALKHLMQTGRSSNAAHLQAVAAEVNVMQLLLRQVPSQAYAIKGKSFYSERGHRDLRNGVQLWRGFFHSVRPAPQCMVVNVDISAAAFYTPGNMVDVAMSVLGTGDTRDINPSHRNWKKLENHLKNLQIRVSTHKHKIRTVKGLVKEGGSFEFRVDNIDTTVREFYQRTHGINLRLPYAPGVRLSPKNAEMKIIVPMELCEIIPGQMLKGKLDERCTKEMVSFATLKPPERKAAILSSTFPKTSQGPITPITQYSTSDYLQHAGMTVKNQPVEISGSLLAPPQIQYGNSIMLNPTNGSWNVLKRKLHTPKPLEKWAILNFDSNLSDQQCKEYARGLAQCCMELGMVVKPPGAILHGQKQAPDKTLRGLQQQLPGAPQLLLMLIPPAAEDIRSAIKRFGDVDKGVPTQCIKTDKITGKTSNQMSQYNNNIALKLNARLGGVNSCPALGVLRTIGGPYMIIGIDVSHPGAGVHARPSVASLVFSVDEQASVYRARLSVQPPRTELIQESDLRAMDAVMSFGNKNKMAPENIIIFRDGVSEGEYERVARTEFNIIKDEISLVLKQMSKMPVTLRATFIVVTKRHHVRFFPKDSRQADRSGNCPAGFTTNQAMASPGILEFYLQSHSGLLGTSRPSHYIVIEDEIFRETLNGIPGLTRIQELAYLLCHVYAKATRSVSIPAPVYYADLACGRANFYFDPDLLFDDTSTVSSGTAHVFDINRWKQGFRPIHAGIRDTMFFL